MDRRLLGLSIVLVFASGIGGTSGISSATRVEPIHAAGETAAEQVLDDYTRTQQALFDALREDPSPRVQVLARSVYLDEDAAANALRPKRADVASRAAQLAPDDAFVQWIAASGGNYYSSQCGPTQWPVAEVANLTRLEPDNAGALLYGVALAQVQGNAEALDASLARMAAATQATDHSGEEIALWRQLHASTPAMRQSEPFIQSTDEKIRTDAAAWLFAWQRAEFRSSSSAASAVQAACKPDAQSERTWQRLGWCADAGRLLASSGNSFALRELGLKLLDATGNDSADLKHRSEWMKANEASPRALSNDKELEAALRDWRGSPSDITATERRMARLGIPPDAPAGWRGGSMDEKPSPGVSGWEAYLREVLQDMLEDSDPHARAAALLSQAHSGEMPPASPESSAALAPPVTLARLAEANPSDRFVQWIAAQDTDKATATAARTRLQSLDGDNLAVWELALAQADADVAEVLLRMASATRYDRHAGESLSIWIAAMERHPLPDALKTELTESASAAELPSDRSIARTTAFMMTLSSLHGGSTAMALRRHCPTDAKDALRETCTAIARRMFDSNESLVTAQIGESQLRRLDAFTEADQERSRRIAWWQSRASGMEQGALLETYIDDYLATGSEIDALQRRASRAGQAEPPADWKSAAEQHRSRKN